MAKGKYKNFTNRNQDHSSSSKPSTPTSAILRYPNTPENLELDVKSYLMMMVEDIKKDFKKPPQEIQENTAKEVQIFKEKQENTTKRVAVLKEQQKNTTKQMMELNKTIKYLKREVETIKKTQNETMMEIEALGKKSGTIDASNQQ
jgi:chromosome segregation ATPase